MIYSNPVLVRGDTSQVPPLPNQTDPSEVSVSNSFRHVLYPIRGPDTDDPDLTHSCLSWKFTWLLILFSWPKIKIRKLVFLLDLRTDWIGLTNVLYVNSHHYLLPYFFKSPLETWSKIRIKFAVTILYKLDRKWFQKRDLVIKTKYRIFFFFFLRDFFIQTLYDPSCVNFGQRKNVLSIFGNYGVTHDT